MPDAAALYEAVFNSAPTGNYLLSPTLDAIILAVNDALLKASGRQRQELVGISLFAAFPANPDDPGDTGEAQLRASLARVIATGQADTLAAQRYPIRITLPCGEVHYEERFWDAVNTPIFGPDGALACIAHSTTDVTAALRVQATLQGDDARQAILLALSDALRTITDPREIWRSAVRLLGDCLDLSRCYYFDVERGDQGGWVHIVGAAYQRDPDLPEFTGRHALDDFGSQLFEGLARGEVVAVTDTGTHPGLSSAERAAYAEVGVAAFINVPLLRHGRYVAGIGVHHATPRVWQEREFDLIREVAARTWVAVERAQAELALRQSEDHFRALVTASSNMIYRMSPDWREMRHLFGRDVLTDTVAPVENWDDTYLLPEDKPAIFERIDEAIRTRSPFEMEHRVRQGDGSVGWMQSRAIPIFGADGDVKEWFGAGSDVTWRKRAEEAVSESAAKYRGLFESIDEGFCIIEVLFDDAGKPVDYLFAETNPAFGKQTGWPDAVGKRMRSIAPAHEQFWFDTFGRIVRSGHPERFEHRVAAIGSWFSVFAFRIGRPEQHCVAVLFDDIQERKQRELHIAVLDQISADLARLSSADEIIDTVGARLGAHLDGAQCIVADVDQHGAAQTVQHTGRPGAADVQGKPFSLRDYMSEESVTSMRAGRTLVVHDVAANPAPGAGEGAGPAVGALVATPFLIGGRWTGYLAALSAGARNWRPDEIRLLKEVAERLFPRIERARADAALRDSLELLRQFGEASQDVLWVRDTITLQWQYLSPAFDAIYGMRREEVLRGDNYRNWLDMILPEDRTQALDNIKRVIGGEQVVFEYRIRRPADGAIRWMRDTDFPMRGCDGQVERIGGVGQDVTAIKEAQAALAAAEQRQRHLLESIPQLVWRSHDGGQWIWASPQWIGQTGLSNEASCALGWLDALHPDDRDSALDAWQQAASSGLYQATFRIRQDASGEYRWFQTRGTPVRQGDGAVVEWLGTSTDVDEQVRAREFLTRAGEELERRVAERTLELQQALDTLHKEASDHEQAEERLRQSEKLKAIGQLTGGIAHDFNNMLQGITSALALVRTRLGQGRVADAAGYIDPAQKAASRAGALTHRLLAFSRQQTLTPEAVSMDLVAQGMEDMIRRTVGPTVQVELKLGDGRWLVLCDPNQLESALLNLSVNARDAMPDGGWLTITTEERNLSADEVAHFEDLQPGRYASLSVSDTGTGIAPEVAARLFEPFFTTKPIGQGTGLGLSQIYGFMRQSGGLVQIETGLGKGTTVRLCLPFYEMNPKDQRAPAINGKTLLLVEDEHDVRALLADQLRDLGYRVLEADTAASAMRILNTGANISLLVTDVGLRGGANGRQLADMAREKLPALPTIFITGFAGSEPLSGENVVRKPFETSVLVDLIEARISAATAI